ncbi:hypothetical protein Anapl_01230 [Anas platyrhynchos]|uniref:Uncharacterized protein n=1 Tax=Anas platyrhynchos TaxID=8839 RepID=R0M0I5_ANAPL|nr:hypothetical protein Anapl_01230 [Anas platyrhynchos]
MEKMIQNVRTGFLSISAQNNYPVLIALRLTEPDWQNTPLLTPELFIEQTRKLLFYKSVVNLADFMVDRMRTVSYQSYSRNNTTELLLEGETGVGKKREEFLPWSPLQSSAGIDNKASVVPTHKIVSHCISIYAEDICTLCALFGWDGEQLSIADAT